LKGEGRGGGGCALRQSLSAAKLPFLIVPTSWGMRRRPNRGTCPCTDPCGALTTSGRSLVALLLLLLQTLPQQLRVHTRTCAEVGTAQQRGQRIEAAGSCEAAETEQ